MIKKIINLSIYLLRYFSIINTKYKVSNKINFGSKQSNIFFQKKLKKCKVYFEYGAGNSTLLANKLKKKYISIEADKSFFNYLKYQKKISNLKYIDIGPTKYFSYPILPFFLIQKKIELYCNHINLLYLYLNKVPDLILIDGRFRVKTFLSILEFLIQNKIQNKIIIIIDDYQNRYNYKILEKIVQINKIGRFGVIKYSNYKYFTKKKINDLIFKSKKDIM